MRRREADIPVQRFEVVWASHSPEGREQANSTAAIRSEISICYNARPDHGAQVLSDKVTIDFCNLKIAGGRYVGAYSDPLATNNI